MARLTEKLPDGTCQIPASILYLTNGMQSVIRKLADYEDKMEQGLLVELPCEIGSTVYVISMCGNVKNVLDGDFETATGYYCPFELDGLCPHDCDACEDVTEKLAVFEDTINYIGYDKRGVHLFTEKLGMCCTIGENTFLTQEEAEEALKSQKGAVNDSRKIR